MLAPLPRTPDSAVATFMVLLSLTAQEYPSFRLKYVPCAFKIVDYEYYIYI